MLNDSGYFFSKRCWEDQNRKTFYVTPPTFKAFQSEVLYLRFLALILAQHTYHITPIDHTLEK